MQMEQELLTLNWNAQRTRDEESVREYFTQRGWEGTEEDDVVTNGQVSFRIVDFGEANCLNFVAPLEELPQVVYDFILELDDAPTITLGLDGDFETEVLNTWSWKEFVDLITGDDE